MPLGAGRGCLESPFPLEQRPQCNSSPPSWLPPSKASTGKSRPCPRPRTGVLRPQEPFLCPSPTPRLQGPLRSRGRRGSSQRPPEASPSRPLVHPVSREGHRLCGRAEKDPGAPPGGPPPPPRRRRLLRKPERAGEGRGHTRLPPARRAGAAPAVTQLPGVQAKPLNEARTPPRWLCLQSKSRCRPSHCLPPPHHAHEGC